MLALFVTGTLMLWKVVADRQEAERLEHFDALVGQARSALLDRLDTIALAQVGAAGLFARSRTVTREEWAVYVKGFFLERPSFVFRSVGFTRRVAHADLEEFLEARRAEGIAGYAVRPPGRREEYYLVKHVEPHRISATALGYDSAASPLVRPVLDRACARAEPLMTPTLAALEDAPLEGHGFLLVRPVFRSAMPPADPAERGRDCLGWVFASFVMENFFASVLDETFPGLRKQLDLRLHEGSEAVEERRIAGAPLGPPPRDVRFLEAAVPLETYGARLTLHARTTKDWVFADNDDESTGVLLGGLSMGIALFIVLEAALSTRRRAVALADKMTVDVRKLGRALIEQQATLARADRLAAVGEVAAGLAHELRNPLAGIQMTLENIRQEAPEGDAAVRMDAVVNETQRLSRLLDRHLAAARHEPEPLVEVRLHETVGDLIEILRPTVAAEITLANRVEDGLVARLPQDRIRQALLNLMKNAVESMGDRAGSVQVLGARDGEVIELAVCDDGPGFPEEMVGKPVAPFLSSKSGGTGLGLAIVRRLAKDLGGELRLENRPEGGARVSLRLPFGSRA